MGRVCHIQSARLEVVGERNLQGEEMDHRLVPTLGLQKGWVKNPSIKNTPIIDISQQQTHTSYMGLRIEWDGSFING